MLRSRDFYLVKVYNLKGKYLGVVEDIVVDFNSGIINGLLISGISILKKNNYIQVEDIISFQECIIVKNTSRVKVKEILCFKDIKYMDIINATNVMIGVLEDIIIDLKDFTIKGLIMSSGIFDKMIKGKEIINIKSSILCESYILYSGGNSVVFQTLPHNLGGLKQ